MQPVLACGVGLSLAAGFNALSQINNRESDIRLSPMKTKFTPMITHEVTTLIWLIFR